MSTILLLMQEGENRRRLASFLSERYEVREATDEAALQEVFDLCLLDGPTFDRMQERIGARRERERPVHLPFLLVTSRDDVRLSHRRLWRLIDDVIILPVLKTELLARAEALLRARRLSQESEARARGLRESEEKYHTLFNSVDEGFCIIEMLFDADGRPVDYRFLEVNPAFERQTGLHEAEGKLMRDLAPEHEAHWFETYGKVASTGEPARFVNEAKALKRWYDVYCL